MPARRVARRAGATATVPSTVASPGRAARCPAAGPTGARASECTLALEHEARTRGFAIVAGVDEVGRGALCGPVMAGAVVLSEAFDPGGIDDSKRLTRRQREQPHGDSESGRRSERNGDDHGECQ